MNPPFIRAQFVDHPLILRTLLPFRHVLLTAVSDLLRDPHVFFLQPVNVAPHIGRLLFHPFTLYLPAQHRVFHFPLQLLLLLLQMSQRFRQIHLAVPGRIVIGRVILELRRKGFARLHLQLPDRDGIFIVS